VSDDSVLVATARLDDAIRSQVTEACEHARVRPFFWSPEGPENPGAPRDPSLLIATLPAGLRTIPDDITTLATQTFQALPLLLLCGEPLVRHSVSLQGGRVTLLGQPLTREKISARIRTAVVGPAAAGDSSGHVASDRRLRVRELRGREWWAGVVCHDPDTASRSPELGDVFPTLCKLGRHGVVGLVPLDPSRPLPSSVLQQAALGLASGLPSEQAGTGLESTVGGEAAAAWFSPATVHWSFYAPRDTVELWLYSPLRLPSLWRVPTPGETSAWRVMPAASGDVVLLVAGPGGTRAADDLRSGLARAAEDGGPALLDHLEARLAAASLAGSALIMELR
jgi:hypothetical protein